MLKTTTTMRPVLGEDIEGWARALREARRRLDLPCMLECCTHLLNDCRVHSNPGFWAKDTSGRFHDNIAREEREHTPEVRRALVEVLEATAPHETERQRFLAGSVMSRAHFLPDPQPSRCIKHHPTKCSGASTPCEYRAKEGHALVLYLDALKAHQRGQWWAWLWAHTKGKKGWSGPLHRDTSHHPLRYKDARKEAGCVIFAPPNKDLFGGRLCPPLPWVQWQMSTYHMLAVDAHSSQTVRWLSFGAPDLFGVAADAPNRRAHPGGALLDFAIERVVNIP